MHQDSSKMHENKVEMSQEKLSQNRLQARPGLGQDGAKMGPSRVKMAWDSAKTLNLGVLFYNLKNQFKIIGFPTVWDFGTKMCQDSPKTREDRRKINQEKHRLSQDRLQDGPGYGQDGAKMPPNWAKIPQR